MGCQKVSGSMISILKQFLSFSFNNIMHLRDFITSLFQNEPDTKVYVI